MKQTYEWHKNIQSIVDEMDGCIKRHEDEALTLRALSKKLGYSEYYTTRKFKEIAHMSFREYLRRRRLAFALIEVRDSTRDFLEIALDYGFSSHEAFTRAFKETYGMNPSEYRKRPIPLVLRTKITPFDRYFLGMDEIGMVKSDAQIKIYFVTIPAHKYLHIKNYESNGYWSFWQVHGRTAGQDCETICGLLDSIKGKLDDEGGSEPNSSSGHVMAYINDPRGFDCGYGTARAESYGVRLKQDYKGEVPSQMSIMDVPEGEYIVFEHGPFDYEQENRSVENQIEKAMADFDYSSTGYAFDNSEGRVCYFYHNPNRFWKYIRPVKRV